VVRDGGSRGQRILRLTASAYQREGKRRLTSGAFEPGCTRVGTLGVSRGWRPAAQTTKARRSPRRGDLVLRSPAAAPLPPQPIDGIELIVDQQPPAIASDQANRFDDVVEDLVGDEVVEVHPHPAGLDAFTTSGDLRFELVRALQIDVEQPMSARAGAGTPAAGLDAEQVVEDSNHEVVMETASGRRPDPL
jgi:hypothetical protein